VRPGDGVLGGEVGPGEGEEADIDVAVEVVAVVVFGDVGEAGLGSRRGGGGALAGGLAAHWEEGFACGFG
jgi:hypothetical protein